MNLFLHWLTQKNIPFPGHYLDQVYSLENGTSSRFTKDIALHFHANPFSLNLFVDIQMKKELPLLSSVELPERSITAPIYVPNYFRYKTVYKSVYVCCINEIRMTNLHGKKKMT